MEREQWAELMKALRDLARSFTDNAYHTHSTVLIVRVYLWAVLHDRPTSWACDPRNWDHATRPKTLPSQSTMSRRLRGQAVQDLLGRMGRRLNGRTRPDAASSSRIIDGKPLVIAPHSADPDARFGPAYGRTAKGYKLHAIWADAAMPECWDVRPMNHDEKTVAHQLIPGLTGRADLLGDTFYHANKLFKTADDHGQRLLAPRIYPGTAIRQPRRFHPARLACVALLEDPGQRARARAVFVRRRTIETRFAHLTSFGGGLTGLPPWVRRLHRVRLYVHAKLLINAARIRCIRA